MADTTDTAAEKPVSHDCHNTGDSPREHGKGLRRWWMLLCCIVPLVLAAGLLFGGAKGLASLGRTAAPLLILLLCPLMHLLMMRGMGHGDRK
jgi:hypothetical protein